MIRITIIGMGLIGTSLGMALRSADESSAPLGKITITGYDANARNTAEARGRLAIDREARNLGEALRDAQLVVVAVPVQAVRDVFRAIAPLLGPGMVVTDTASTKAEVLAWARELLPATIDFVGGHPMAGREKSGPAAAETTLFRDAIYCLTPTPVVRPQALELVEAMVQQVGAKVYFIDPIEHDAYVAGVSHLPFVLSAALVETVSRSPAWKEMMPLAASGFRDMTRLAAGDALMHRDIAMTNRAALMRWLEEAARVLLDVRGQLETGAADEVLELFEHARDRREEWLASKPHMRPGENDFANPLGGAVEGPSLFGRFGRPRDRKR
ncbi:MAG TPA: prephenate dehydrogenase/arogenate dehydrogenase family protein [Roseiflexaceae bacterium]|nr:prephenate dehydrogenase/arogenate dehydrogenase family protein [Roseiflexaceae bacterium]